MEVAEEKGSGNRSNYISSSQTTVPKTIILSRQWMHINCLN